MILKPGDRVVRNPETWKFLWLNDPRAGLGVGEVYAVGWSSPHPMTGPYSSALVRWGNSHRSSDFGELLPASPTDEGGPDYDDLAILWPAFSAEWVKSYGSELHPALLEDVRRRYKARLKAIRGDR